MTFVGRRVLVVENEFLVSLLTIDVLESVGCEIIGPAARVAEAVQLAQSELLDAAVLDIDLGGEMIWPVAEELQRRGVPFLFLSAVTQLTLFPPLFSLHFSLLFSVWISLWRKIVCCAISAQYGAFHVTSLFLCERNANFQAVDDGTHPHNPVQRLPSAASAPS